MHPVGKTYDFSGGNFLSAFSLELFPHFLREDLDNPMGWNSVVLVQNHLFLIFIGWDNLQIVGPKLFLIYLLNTVNELDGGRVPILGKEWYCCFTSFYRLQYSAHGLVHKKCILNFILGFLSLLAEQTFYDWSVIWLGFSIIVVFIIILFVIGLLSLLIPKLAGDLRRINGPILVFGFPFIVFLSEG